MKNIWSSGIRPLLRAAHFGPTVLVVTISFLISASTLSFFDSAKIAIAIFFGQLMVGWSNDLIDFPLDQEAHRISKPLVSGDLEVQVLKVFLALAVMLVLLTSFIAPWGLRGAVIHLLGILIAMSYNLRLKATIFSPLPYLLSFGGLPWAIYASTAVNPPTWLYLGLALLATAFHFLNVIKDLKWDLAQEVNGLPQRLGRDKSIGIAGLCTLGAILQAIAFR